MKPCYRHKEDLYLLAHLVKESGHLPQPCKALISPGNCPLVTRATGEFLRRCKWLTSEAVPSEKGSETAVIQREESSKETAQLVHCKLVVGKCQLSTVLQVVDDVEFSDHCVLSKWHIHIGRKDFEALQQNAWDADICYLSTSPMLGWMGSRPKCALCCASFTAALENSHIECLSYWHTDGVKDHQRKCYHQLDQDPYESIKAARMLSAETLMHVHDVLEVPWGVGTCAAAAASGSIDCLSYARASGCPWDSATCECAAAAGNLHCLAYAHEHGCDWHTGVLLVAAKNRHLDCLKYAHTHGCPYTTSEPLTSYMSGPTPERTYLTTLAVQGASMPCLMYMREAMGVAWDPEGSEFQLAFEMSNLKLLQYIHLHGGVLFQSPFELPNLNYVIWLWASGTQAERKAMCLLYLRCHGGCQFKRIRHTMVGDLLQQEIEARRVAVLLSFNAAGRAGIGEPMVAAAHAVMQRMPSHLTEEIMCAAGLQNLEY